MPFHKMDIMAMPTDTEEYLTQEEIAGRFGVSERTIDRVFEKYAKKLKKNQRRDGRKKLYFWPDALKYVKLHLELVKENVPSITIKKMNTKQRIRELEKENERLRGDLVFQSVKVPDTPVELPDPESIPFEL